MAPKSGPPIAKQNLVLKYFHASGTAHSLRELEKALPSVASINGMQVKDYLQALSDDNKIHVEKIGSGNWYWSFLSEERQARELVLEQLRGEKRRLEGALGEVQGKIDEASEAQRDDDADMLDGGGRTELVEGKALLDAQLVDLRRELEGYKDNDPVEIEKRKGQTALMKLRAERWTDNIFILEGYLRQLTGGDTQALDEIKRSVYGDEYAEGEGLKELQV